jgi:DNA-binding response OmpR family regulator
MASILIVEDNAHQSHLLGMWLRRNGHAISVAANGRDAQEKIDGVVDAGGQFDVIVTDVNMPEVGGLELLAWMRRERKLDTPVVVLSSRCDQVHLRREAEALNARMHPKPFSPSRLVVEIESLLAHGPCGPRAGADG